MPIRKPGNRIPVIDHASLELAKGELVALLGASGSGKSTLLNLLAGIDQADSGSVVIAGHNISTLQEPDLTLFRRQHIGFIYQLFNLIPTLTVFENIALPLELCQIGTAQRLQQVSDWLHQIGLQNRQHAFPDQLSGGEQQRVRNRACVNSPTHAGAGRRAYRQPRCRDRPACSGFAHQPCRATPANSGDCHSQRNSGQTRSSSTGNP